MTEFDLDHLGDVWRAQPDPAEIERLRRSAEAVRRRARWGQFSDHALALLVSAVVIAMMMTSPQPRTAVVGGAAILLMLYGTVRQRQLRDIEVRSLTGSTEDMLDQSIARARATVKRARIGLIGWLPAFGLGIGFAAAVNDSSGVAPLERITTDPGLGLGIVVVLLGGLAVVLGHLFRRLQQSQRQLKLLIETREAYQSETNQST